MWVKWKLVSVRFEVVLISTQDGCTICAECAIVSEVILGTPMELLCYMGQVEVCFNPFGDSVDLDTRQVHGLRQMHYRLRNHFGCTQWYSEVTWVKWILDLVHL